LPLQSAEPPVLLIVAGPNGSGKSSAYQDTNVEAFGRSVWIINPDLLAARIRDVEDLALAAANLEAVQRIEAWLEASIRAHQTVGVETVLSTGKYRRLVETAKQLGFELRLIYVCLDSAQRNVERVRLRVKKGDTLFPRTRSSNATFDPLSKCLGFWSGPIKLGSMTIQARSRDSSARSARG
jgi:predicted ABC-type ATPase